MSIPWLLLLLWFGTVIVTFQYDVSQSKSLLQKIIEFGYRLDVERWNAFVDNELPEEFKKMHRLKTLIPVYNMAYIVQYWIFALDSSSVLFEQLRVFDCLIPLNEQEKKAYAMNPTMKTVRKIMSDWYVSFPVYDPMFANFEEFYKMTLRIVHHEKKNSYIVFMLKDNQIVILEDHNEFGGVEPDDVLSKAFVHAALRRIHEESDTCVFTDFENQTLIYDIASDKILNMPSLTNRSETEISISEQIRLLQQEKESLKNGEVEKELTLIKRKS